MGKASKWLKNLLGLKKWSFAKSHKDNDVVSRSQNDHDVSKHAAAVTTATVAAAQAAAAVVKLTSNGRSNRTTENSGDVNVTACVSQSGAGYGGREVLAAVMIQSHFRAYLSKRALWALKGLVKLQALVRGHIVRKQTVYTLRQLQAIVRAQTRARLVSESPNFSLKSGPATPEKFEHVSRAWSMKHECLTTLKRNGSNSIIKTSETTLPRDEESIDKSKHKRSLFHSSHFSDQNCHSVLSPSFCEAQSIAQYVDQSPQFYSSSTSKTGAFTPTKSDGSTSCVSLYSDNPNYMAYTESSKAKARSLSAPKQRPIIHYERSSSSSTKKYSVYGYGELKSSTQRVSVLNANFANKAYPGSGHLDSLGVPVRGDVNGLQWQRS